MDERAAVRLTIRRGSRATAGHSETFAAYYQASYVNRKAEAGKRESPLPMF